MTTPNDGGPAVANLIADALLAKWRIGYVSEEWGCDNELNEYSYDDFNDAYRDDIVETIADAMLRARGVDT